MQHIQFVSLVIRIQRGCQRIDHRFHQALGNANDRHPDPDHPKHRPSARQTVGEDDDEIARDKAQTRQAEQPSHAEVIQQRTPNSNGHREAHEHDP